VNSTHDRNKELDDLLNAALRKKARKDYRSARDILTKAVERFPSSAAACGVMGEICWRIGDLPKAIRYFEHAVRLSPKAELASLGLFHSMWESRNERMALYEMERYLKESESKEYKLIKEEIKPTIKLIESEVRMVGSLKKLTRPTMIPNGTSILWLDDPIIHPPGRFCHFVMRGGSYRVRDYMFGTIYYSQRSSLWSNDRVGWLETYPTSYSGERIWKMSPVGVAAVGELRHRAGDIDWWANKLLEMTSRPFKIADHATWFDGERLLNSL
jgi:tetratricopeptide (TPR) repeat protein